MNGTEQRRQATVAEKVDRHAADVQFVLERFDERLFDLATKAQETRRELNTLKAEHLKLAEGLVFRTDGLRDRFYLLESVQQAFHGRTFWQRLRWLFTGR